MTLTSPLPPAMIELVARRFRLIGEPLRIRILELLRDEGEVAAGAIAERLGAGQQNVSKHLTALHSADILARRRDGNRVLYSIADATTLELCEVVCESIERGHEQRGRAINATVNA